MGNTLYIMRELPYFTKKQWAELSQEKKDALFAKIRKLKKEQGTLKGFLKSYFGIGK